MCIGINMLYNIAWFGMLFFFFLFFLFLFLRGDGLCQRCDFVSRKFKAVHGIINGKLFFYYFAMCFWDICYLSLSWRWTNKAILILQSTFTIQEKYQKVVNVCKNSPYCVTYPVDKVLKYCKISLKLHITCKMNYLYIECAYLS
jgi:hypothetical protein